ncbi:NAD-dependent epimerase/dehydratase [Auriculariales sp. MPI-PUGE-AT-0066]|nr:NAD-dependent epimerase/dehydratase [Auriculariales sp. MPI-PUGE-AT-0066]
MTAQHILITGASGFIGSELTLALLAASPDYHLTLSDIVTPSIPPTAEASRITAQQTDLTSTESIKAIVTSQPHWAAVYALHGIMSAGSEANLELGYRVNLDSHRQLYDVLRVHQPGATVVYTSATAVYGPPETAGPARIFTEATLPQPQGSYGTQKFMIECLLNDYTRRGLLDARIVRPPTVVVRSGAPTAAASSFVSSIVREPMKGQRAVLPVAKDVVLWVGSPRTVVRNLVAIKDVPREKFGLSRVVNLPGLSVTVAEILDALEEVGGKERRALVDENRDEAIERLVLNWPDRLDTTRAFDLGLSADVPFKEAVKAFADSLKQH